MTITAVLFLLFLLAGFVGGFFWGMAYARKKSKQSIAEAREDVGKKQS